MATTSTAKAKTILCFDYGSKSIGVAVGQFITQTATPVADLTAKDGIPNWDHINQLIQEWQPDLLLVGLPLNMDGSSSEMAVRAKKFANRLHGRFGLPFAMVDERLSSLKRKAKFFSRPDREISKIIILIVWQRRLFCKVGWLKITDCDHFCRSKYKPSRVTN